jgi:hypothetical protein
MVANGQWRPRGYTTDDGRRVTSALVTNGLWLWAASRKSDVLVLCTIEEIGFCSICRRWLLHFNALVHLLGFAALVWFASRFMVSEPLPNVEIRPSEAQMCT